MTPRVGLMDDARTKLMAQLSRIAPTLSEEQKAERVEWLLETARQPRAADGPIIRVSAPPTKRAVREWARQNQQAVVARLGLSLADLYEAGACFNLCGCYVCRIARDTANGASVERQIGDFRFADCPCASCRLIREALIRRPDALGEDSPLPTGARLLRLLGLVGEGDGN